MKYAPPVVILVGYGLLWLTAGWRVAIAVMTVHLGDYLMSYEKHIFDP